MADDLANSRTYNQFVVSEPILEPVFRYIPDRETIQRLLLRCSKMKDDILYTEL